MSETRFTSSSDCIPAHLKVVGVGGGGGNTIFHMLRNDALEGVDYISINTDLQALSKAPQDVALPIGANLTRGLGAGADPDIGRKAAEESRDSIKARLSGADMVFITAGMGGGTGTGAAAVVAEIARSEGMLTVAVVTRPFTFEGGRRTQAAEAGIEALTRQVDSLIVVPNDRLLPVMGKNASLLKAFDAVNAILKNAVMGIAEMITAPGMINVDFADVRTVMGNQGRAKIGTGTGSGETRAYDAALAAVQSPLLEELDISGARGVLVNITAGPNLSIGEFNEVGEMVRSFASDEATVVIGTSLDMDMTDTMRVSIVAAGLSAQLPASQSSPARAEPTGRQPADARQTREPSAPVSSKPRHGASSDEELLDIPTFLRRSVK